MFQVGDYVIYGYEGVCRVTAVGHPQVPGLNQMREYYLLEPVGHGGQVYTPVDTKTVMRPVHTRQWVQTLLDSAADCPVPSDVPADPRKAAEYYRSVLQQQDCVKSLSLYRLFLERQKRQAAARKALSVTDLRFMKQAEETLCSEIGFALELSTPQALQLLREKCAPQA